MRSFDAHHDIAVSNRPMPRLSKWRATSFSRSSGVRSGRHSSRLRRAVRLNLPTVKRTTVPSTLPHASSQENGRSENTRSSVSPIQVGQYLGERSRRGMRGILPCDIDASNVRVMDSLNDLQSGLQAGLHVGELVRIAPGVQRLTAPNASLMTGPGTNTYLLGDPPVALLDPGPDDALHLTLLRDAVPRLRFIFVTHTHRDHSCGARALAAATGAVIVGLPAPADGLQDISCVPHFEPATALSSQLSHADCPAALEPFGRAPRSVAAAAGSRDIQASAPASVARHPHAAVMPPITFVICSNPGPAVLR